MNKPFYATGLLFAVQVMIISCKKDSSDPKPVAPPHVSSFSPASAAKDSTVTIHGTGFSLKLSDNIVSFNGKAATVAAASDTLLKVIVPVGVKDGRISVSVSGKTDMSADSFRYVYTVSLMAGSKYGYMDGKGANAQFASPMGLASDASGNLYVADFGNRLMRKITPDGTVSTFAGTYKDANVIDDPHGLAVDVAGNIFVSNMKGPMIGKVTSAGVISSFAGTGITGYKDGTAAGSQFYAPAGMAVDATGNLFIADGLNHVIRKIDAGGTVSTFAGDHKAGYKDGATDVAEFDFPIAIAFDTAGNMYVVDEINNMLRKISKGGQVTTVAGSGQQATADGPGATAAFNGPQACVVDHNGNIFVTDYYGNQHVRIVTPEGVVSTITDENTVFADGLTASVFFQPYCITKDPSGNVFIADAYANKIMKIQ